MYLDSKPALHNIKEIHTMGNLIFTLSSTGIGLIFGRHSGELISKLNNADQIIQTAFYNRNNNALTIVYVTRYDNFASLRCQATNLEYVIFAPFSLPTNFSCPSILNWKTLFRTEVLKYPGFIEFDEHNKSVITFCAVSRYCT